MAKRIWPTFSGMATDTISFLRLWGCLARHRRMEAFLRQASLSRREGRWRCPEPVSEINVAQPPQS
jgi:hypothetical protein